jgi:hypothetical protein
MLILIKAIQSLVKTSNYIIEGKTAKNVEIILTVENQSNKAILVDISRK